jgi:hypothetical protein
MLSANALGGVICRQSLFQTSFILLNDSLKAANTIGSKESGSPFVSGQKQTPMPDFLCMIMPFLIQMTMRKRISLNPGNVTLHFHKDQLTRII